MVSAKEELARRVLEHIARGGIVSTDDALRLRNWAVRPEDSLLTLEEIAHHILEHDKNPKTLKAAASRG